MKAFQYVDAKSVREATAALSSQRGNARVLAGGQDLIMEMKDHVAEPALVVNIKNISELRRMTRTEAGHTFGALVTLRDLANNRTIQESYTALADAAGSVGTPQVRNVGTLGGNLCQRPRCFYYRDPLANCRKKGGELCFMAEPDGHSKYGAIFGGNPCWIIHPSDIATALVALDATIHYSDGRQEKSIAAERFFTLPSVDVGRENVLSPDEIVTAVSVPSAGANGRSAYLKFQEKESVDWASAAVGIRANVEDGVLRNVRVVLGGVAPTPWRSAAAEQVLEGQRASRDLANQAAEAALQGAQPLAQNGYKAPLAKVILRRALRAVATGNRAA